MDIKEALAETEKKYGEALSRLAAGEEEKDETDNTEKAENDKKN